MRSGSTALAWMAALVWMITCAGTLQAADAPGVQATVQQPRTFGHVLGDVITQRVLLRSNDERFTPTELPTPQRIGAWFDRREPRIETAADGARWLIVDYQIINTPQLLEKVSLPAWSLQSREGTRLNIPAWEISIAALTPVATAPSVTGEIRPDRAAPLIDIAPIRRQLMVWTAVLLLTLAAWWGWVQQRNFRDRHNKPFARAWHELKSMDDDAPEAWQVLHRAFDRAAGRVVQTDNLPVLFAQAPYLEDLRTRIEQFFEQSSERFFAGRAPQNPVPVRALCRELHLMEKRSTP
jgi:mxaA protein